MQKIDFDYGLFGKLRAAANEEWSGYVNHPFVKQLATGALPQPCFKRFLTQDYLFLIHFARAYALLAYKSSTIGEVRSATKSLNAIVDELPVHVGYCTSWGLTEEMMQTEPEAPETMTYTRFVLDIGLSGDILDLMVALIPCVAGYGEIGQILMSEETTVLEGNPYGDWLRNYEGEHYLQSVQDAINALDDVGKRRGAEARFDRLLQIFRTATRLEADFWQMGLNAERAALSVAAE
ncbi:thiaminase [Pararhizobium polonicum]|jgi:thiaminase/transcriptional activator TenA|uniref:Thiaminase n=1 Tax=Pararhizobium polonicum TaxID=1612624 RepID=A0A1C7P0L7_9HYPH|nr:TenA family protein [Pararhizobium polonicum]OBZ94506.1 thiaminase [Pararhizobium polonicum]